MADSRYLEEGYFDSGYFVYTANAVSTQFPTASLTCFPTVSKSSSYFRDDYIGDGYFASVHESYADLTASSSLTLQLEILGSASLSTSITQTSSGAVGKIGSGSFSVTGSVTGTPERQRKASGSFSTTSSLSASAARTRGGQSQNNSVATSLTSNANFEAGGTASIDTAFFPFIEAFRNRGIVFDNKPWEFENRTWATWYGQTWGFNKFTIEAATSLSASGDRRPGYVGQPLLAEFGLSITPNVGNTKTASATLSDAFATTFTGIVGNTELASATLNSEATMATASVYRAGGTATLDSESSLSVIGGRRVGGIATLASEATISANGIAQVLGSATLSSEFDIRIVTPASGFLFPTATLECTPKVGQTELFSATLETSTNIATQANMIATGSGSYSVTAVQETQGNYQASGVGDFDSFVSTLAFGKLITFDPLRELDVTQETRILKVYRETRLKLVEQETRLRKIRQESSVLEVEQETRNYAVLDTAFSER